MKKYRYKIIGILIISSVIYYYLKNILLSLLIIVTPLVYYYLKKIDDNKRNKKLLENKEYEFANMLSYLLVFLENHFNVYQSLKMCINFTNEILIDDLEKLIEEIDLDTSIVPYQNFANKFESNIIYQVVMMIYQLDVNGYDSKYLSNFPSLINNLKQAKILNMINSRKMNMSFLTITPIISLLVVIFSFVVFILYSLGGI